MLRPDQRTMTNDSSTESSTVPGWARPLVGKNPKVTLIRAALFVAIAVATYYFALTPIKVYGVSMEPTFRQGKVLLLNRLAYRSQTPQRSDIVVIRMAGGSVVILKRVIALPGETISIVQGQVHIDGEPLDEPYIRERNENWNYGPKKVNDGRYFVIGDNRMTHIDKQEFGFASPRDLMGRVIQ
jgi:signal peptidase I